MTGEGQTLFHALLPVALPDTLEVTATVRSICSGAFSVRHTSAVPSISTITTSVDEKKISGITEDETEY